MKHRSIFVALGALALVVAVYLWFALHETTPQEFVGNWRFHSVRLPGHWAEDQTFGLFATGKALRRGWSVYTPALGSSDTAITLDMSGEYRWAARHPLGKPRQLCLFYEHDDHTPPMGCYPVHLNSNTLTLGQTKLERTFPHQ